MERRFVLFLTISMLILLANAWWQLSHMPPPKPKAPAAEAAVAAAGEAQADEEEADKEKAPADNAGEEPGDKQLEGADDEAPAGAEEEPAAERGFVTLGSLDDTSAYKMLVTLTNEGAGVRRIELNGSRYHDLDKLEHRVGYLGNLELTRKDGVLLVGAVGPGTPAAAAGLQPGDEIVAAGKQELVPVVTAEEFLVAVKARPRSTVKIRIRRDGAEQELEAKLALAPLELIRPESENARLRLNVLPADFVEPASFQTTLSQVGEESLAALHEKILNNAAERNVDPGELPTELPGVDLLTANWRIVEQSEDSVTFERRIPAKKVTLRKRYRLAKFTPPAEAPGASLERQPTYHLVLELSIRNDGEAARTIAYEHDGPNGLPIEGWWYANKIGRNWGASGLRDVIGRHFGSGDPKMVAPAVIAQGKAEDKDFEAGSLAYMGVDAQYFSVVMIPQKSDSEDKWIERVESVILGPPPKQRSNEARYANVSFRMFSQPHELAAGETLAQEYLVFAGPKNPDVLADYRAVGSKTHTLGDLLYYGWFGGVARTMLGILHFFYGIVGNYGLSIIMLTVLVRGLMFPISRNQAKSMARMQLLKPEMDKLKEKYKGDQQKQAAAMQELYRKHGVNPLAGCLPMLIQLPVFVGLYRGLAVDIELRQAPLFGTLTRWCSNLAAPDMLFDWSGFMPDAVTNGQTFLIGLGPYLNVLPLVTMGLFLLQQKMFMPPPADEQAALQQKMMKYMMAFMGLMFYKVPSGLCLYFIASSLWGIAERKLIPQPTAPALAATAASSPSSRPERNSSDRKKTSGKKRR